MATSTGKRARRQYGNRYACKRAKSRKRKKPRARAKAEKARVP